MTIDHFAKLSDLEKSLFIYNSESTFIAKYIGNDSIVQTYSYYDFFIEVQIDIQTKAFEITPFKQGFSLIKELRQC